MGLPHSLRDHLFAEDSSYEVLVQRSIHRLEEKGKIANKIGIGEVSKRVLTNIESNTLNVGSNCENLCQDFDTVILIDRSFDMITPLIGDLIE